MVSKFRRNPTLKKAGVASIFFFPILLSLIGIFFVFEASSVSSATQFHDSFYFFRLQAIWVVIGIFGMILMSFFDYHNLYYIAFMSMIATIILLVAVLIPGIGSAAGGARRWIDLGFFSLQPTEIAKFSVILYLSSWFIHKERKRFFSFIMLLGILIGLIMLQPDMGTASIVFGISIIIYFLAGIDLHYLLLLIPASVAGFIVLVKTSPYRFQRIVTFLNPSHDPLGVGYHVNQILISLGNGGFFGQGFGASRQKYLFLPEAHTDSIFAIIAEELGYVGSVLLILGFAILLYQIYKAGTNSKDRFGRLLAGGILAYFSLQITINLAGMVGLMPLTGVPLPFISYGGSHILVSFALMGMLINIAKRVK